MAASSSTIRIEPVAGSTWCMCRRTNTADIAASDIDCLSHHGKFKGKCRALVRTAAYLDLAGVLLDNSIAHGETESGAATLSFAGFYFCREEWIVDAIQVLWRNTGPGVGDYDSNSVTVLGGDFQSAAIRHRILGVQEEIKEDLLQLAAVAHDAREISIEITLDVYSSRFELVLEQRERVLNDTVQIKQLEFAAAGAREIEETVDDLGSAECLLRDLFQNRRTLVVTL